MIADFFLLFTRRLRLSKPWRYKFPLIFAFTYVFFYTDALSAIEILRLLLFALMTSIGFAGIAYISNDFSDRKQDEAVGKTNGLQGFGLAGIIALVALFSLLALYPWFSGNLPSDRWSLGLVGLEIALFLLYALPPFRLKEHKWGGLLVDAAYAHVVPAILASWTFHLASGQTLPHIDRYLILLAIWQLFSGLRNILSHQMADYANDVESGTRTAAVVWGPERSRTIQQFAFLLPELLAFLAYLLFATKESPWVLLFLLPHGLIATWQYKRGKKHPEATPLKRFTTLFVDVFYVQWLPYIVLGGLIFHALNVRWIFVLHFLLFTASTLPFWKGMWEKVRQSPVFNYTHYIKGLAIHVGILLVYVLGFSWYYVQLRGQYPEDDVFFFHQRQLSFVLIAVIFSHALLVLTLRFEQTRSHFRNFIFEPVSPYNLAILRIIFYLFSLGEIVGYVFGQLPAWVYLPESQRVGLPFASWVNYIPVSPELYYGACIAGIVLALCGLLGFRTRWTLVLYIPVALYIWGVPCIYGKVSHNHIMFWLPAILAFSRVSDVWSLDALLRRFKGSYALPSDHWLYGIPIKGLWALLAIIYCCSGFHKLYETGLYWGLSDNLAHQIQLEWVENYDVVSTFRIDNYPLLLKMAGMAVMLFEILYPLFLLSAATRAVNIVGSWCLHLSAGYFLHIDFIMLRRLHLSMINYGWIVKRFRPGEGQQAMHPTLNPWKLGLTWVILILLTGNLLMGISGTTSIPFSAYPSYTALVDDRVSMLEFRAYSANGEELKVWQEGKKTGFQWENIRPFETKIAQTYTQDGVLKQDTLGLNRELREYWELWRVNVPLAVEAKKVEFSLKVTPLRPEERSKVLHFLPLGTLDYEETGDRLR